NTTPNSNRSPTISTPKKGPSFPHHVRQNSLSAGIRDRHFNHPPVPGGGGDQDSSDRAVPQHRAADRHGFHFLSRRQRQCPRRIGSDSPGAVHQRRPEHALHHLLGNQCR